MQGEGLPGGDLGSYEQVRDGSVGPGMHRLNVGTGRAQLLVYLMGAAVCALRGEEEDLGRLPRLPGFDEEMRPSLKRLRATAIAGPGQRPARLQGDVRRDHGDRVVGVPGPDDVLGQQRGEAGTDFTGLCGLVEAQEIAPFGRQLHVAASAGFQGLDVAEVAPMLGESPPCALAGRSSTEADGVDDLPGSECQ